jgi:hypothetical protein
MLRLVDLSPRRRNRAVTLIEAVLYISIALALIVGGLVFFQQASRAAKTSTVVRQLSAGLAEARILMSRVTPYSPTTDITSVLIAAGAVPPDMVASPTSLSNPFGGETRFFTSTSVIGNRVILITLTNVPQEVCVRLLTATSEGPDFEWHVGAVGNSTIISDGYARASVAAPAMFGEFVGYNMNLTQAGWLCTYGSDSYYTLGGKTVKPTTDPLSGNVNIAMYFLADGRDV